MSRHVYTTLMHEQVLDPGRPKYFGFPWRASGASIHLDDETLEWFPQNATVLVLGPFREVDNWGHPDYEYRVRICGHELWLGSGFIYGEPDAVWDGEG